MSGILPGFRRRASCVFLFCHRPVGDDADLCRYHRATHVAGCIALVVASLLALAILFLSALENLP